MGERKNIMKKKGILITGGIVACVLIIVGVLLLAMKPQNDEVMTDVDRNSGTSKSGDSGNNTSKNGDSENNTTNEDSKLIAPVLEWWELYNPNGFDTVTATIRNDNNVAIDVSYDLVYYKDNKEVARSEDFSNFSILPNRNNVIWANFDIPKASEVDEVKMENVIVTEAYYGAIDGKYEYLGTKDGEARFKFEFEKKPTLANIMFILYNDKNGNKKCDKGEIVVTSTDSITEQESTDYFAYPISPLFPLLDLPYSI